MNATHPILVTNAARMARGRGGPAPPPPGRFLKEGAIRAAAGFTLVEVLLAIGIFLIGIVAIATVFPTGIAVQREAVDDMTTQLIANNAKQEMVATALSGIDESDPLTFDFDTTATIPPRRGTLAPLTLPSATPPPGTVQALVPMPMPRVAGSGMTIPTPPVDFSSTLPFSMRSYPDTVQPVSDRDYYWYPFTQIGQPASNGNPATVNDPGSTGGAWQGYVFILRRRGTNPPPQVRSVSVKPDNSTSSRLIFDSAGFNNLTTEGLPGFIQPGDQVLLGDGSIYKVVLVDGNGLTVDGPLLGDPNQTYNLYFGVNVDRSGAPAVDGNDNPVGGHSPTLRIEAFGLPIQTPKP